jgi:hypothetical protein
MLMTDAQAVKALGEMAREYDERAEHLICLQRNAASVLKSNRGAKVGQRS